MFVETETLISCHFHVSWNITILLVFLESVILGEVSQTEKENYRMTPLFILNEMRQMNLLTKQKETHRLRERTSGCWRGGESMGRRDS